MRTKYVVLTVVTILVAAAIFWDFILYLEVQDVKKTFVEFPLPPDPGSEENMMPAVMINRTCRLLRNQVSMRRKLLGSNPDRVWQDAVGGKEIAFEKYRKVQWMSARYIAAALQMPFKLRGRWACNVPRVRGPMVDKETLMGNFLVNALFFALEQGEIGLGEVGLTRDSLNSLLAAEYRERIAARPEHRSDLLREARGLGLTAEQVTGEKR